jgi:hypothetical protein
MEVAGDAGALAADVAAAARVLAEVTDPAGDWPGLHDPASVHEVVGALGVAAREVEQTAGRLARFLKVRLASGALSVHGNYAGDPAAAVTAATDRLEQVQLVARVLAGALEDAQGVTAAIGAAGEEQR